MNNYESIREDFSMVLLNSNNRVWQYLLNDKNDILTKICNMILDQNIDYKEIPYKSYYDLMWSINTASDFFRSFGIEEEFNNAIRNGSFYFDFEDDDADNTYVNYWGTGEKNISIGEGDELIFHHDDRIYDINIPVLHNINDLFSIAHEFMHVYTDKGYSLNKSIFTEAMPISIEYKLFKYLKDRDLISEDTVNGLLFRLTDLKKSLESLSILLSAYNYFNNDIDYSVNIDIDTSLSIENYIKRNIVYSLCGLIGVIEYYQSCMGFSDNRKYIEKCSKYYLESLSEKELFKYLDEVLEYIYLNIGESMEYMNSEVNKYKNIKRL